jgi:hypothetical protein
MTTTKMENVRDNPRAILEILDESESESDKESTGLGIETERFQSMTKIDT